jgi:hypothetical protein
MKFRLAPKGKLVLIILHGQAGFVNHQFESSPRGTMTYPRRSRCAISRANSREVSLSRWARITASER